MGYLLEILCNLIGWDFFDNFQSNSCMFNFWEIESEADSIEIENLVKKGIISREDANILLVYKKDILLELQNILNDSHNHSKKHSVRLIWECMREYGLSDSYIKSTIRQLYHLL